MLNLKDICQKIFRLKSRECVETEKTDPVTEEFKTRYWNFKNLLALNQKVLENMSCMEQAYAGEKIYGFGFLRKNNTELSVCLFRVITLLDRIAPGKYRGLLERFEDIQSRLNMICSVEEKAGEDDSAWICRNIEDLSSSDSDMAGSKAANLGEISKNTDMHVPEGFVLSRRAFRLFIDKNQLQPHLEQIVQCVDFENLAMVYEASSRLKKLIQDSPVPDEIMTALNFAWQQIARPHGSKVRLAVRSSATGEDGLETSYAGQYLSILEVASQDLADAYKKVLASKYNARAMLYRHNKGLDDHHVHMCVAFLVMQEALSGGVVYTMNPETGTRELIISALHGLPKSLVDGSTNPDLLIYSRELGKITGREIHEQKTMLSYLPGKGIEKADLDPKQRTMPAISDKLALKLAQSALKLEKHFGEPQDIEWCRNPSGRIVILQSRPLQLHQNSPDQPAEDSCYTEFRAKIASRNIKPVISGGITACSGVAWGKVHIVANAEDAARFPQGAILVSRDALPRWSALVGKASGLITDRGAAAGHLATVAREFNVPALFNSGSATRDLAHISQVTLDAKARQVFPLLIQCSTSSGSQRRLMSDTPVQNAMKQALELICPLNLTDPERNDFRPEHCRTCHDILRFCHEKAVDEMFSLGNQYNGADISGKRLVAGEPTQWWLVDIGGGFKKIVPGNRVRLSEIRSGPFLKIWEGMTSHTWHGPPGADAKGLFSIMLESTMNRDLDLSGPSSFTQKNYALISNSFCSLSCRYGYHYSVLQAMCKDLDRENYIRFGFKGGAANMDRKRLRLRMIAEILEEWDFQVKIKEDVLNAHFEGLGSMETMKRLKILGYLIVHTRQMDMVMNDKNQYACHQNRMKQEIRDISA
jgi:pyruvate, water dikinase